MNGPFYQAPAAYPPAGPTPVVCPPMYRPGLFGGYYTAIVSWTVVGLFLIGAVTLAMIVVTYGRGPNPDVWLFVSGVLGTLCGVIALSYLYTFTFRSIRQVGPHMPVSPGFSTFIAATPIISGIGGALVTYTRLASAQLTYLRSHGLAASDARVPAALYGLGSTGIVLSLYLGSEPWLILSLIFTSAMGCVLHYLIAMNSDQIAAHATHVFGMQHAAPVPMMPPAYGYPAYPAAPYAPPAAEPVVPPVDEYELDDFEWYEGGPVEIAAEPMPASSSPVPSRDTHPLPGHRVPLRETQPLRSTNRGFHPPSAGEWQPIQPIQHGQPKKLYRLPVPGGWYIATEPSLTAEIRTFYADPSHRWDAETLPSGLF